MNCDQMRMLLPAFANDELSEEERQMVELHLAACVACRQALEELRDLEGRLALLHAITLDTEIADSIILRIKRMTDTQAPETALGNTDKLSSRVMDKVENDSSEEIVPDLPTKSHDSLFPGLSVQGEP